MPGPEPAPQRGARFARFLVSGAFNTLLTYGLYLLLLQVLPYGWSYTLAYAAGIVLAYVLQRYFVFQRAGGRAAPFLVLLIYGVQYLLGLAAVWLWASVLGLPVWLAPLFAIALSLPVTFLLSSKVFRGKPAGVGP